jgi:hypothetical protein
MINQTVFLRCVPLLPMLIDGDSYLQPNTVIRQSIIRLLLGYDLEWFVIAPAFGSNLRPARREPPLSLDKRHLRLFLAPLPFVHLLNLLFDDANGLIQPVRVLTHPLDFNCRKPLAGVLRGLAQGLELSGTP